MPTNKRVVLSCNHTGIQLRHIVTAYIGDIGWEVVDIGPTTPESTPYPKHGEAAAQLVASGDWQFEIVLCSTGQGIMIAANKVKGVRVIGEGVALDIVDAFLSGQFEDGRHATRVEMIEALEG